MNKVTLKATEKRVSPKRNKSCQKQYTSCCNLKSNISSCQRVGHGLIHQTMMSHALLPTWFKFLSVTQKERNAGTAWQCDCALSGGIGMQNLKTGRIQGNFKKSGLLHSCKQQPSFPTTTTSKIRLNITTTAISGGGGGGWIYHKMQQQAQLHMCNSQQDPISVYHGLPGRFNLPQIRYKTFIKFQHHMLIYEAI